MYKFSFVSFKDVSSSSSSGSQKLTSDDESSSDSGEIAGNFNCPTERQGEEYSAVHEVVCGREFSNSFLKDQVFIKIIGSVFFVVDIASCFLAHTKGGICGKPTS